MSSLEDAPATIQKQPKLASPCKRRREATATHANEKLSTFWIAAPGLPLIVMFVNGVLCSVSFPYQSIARTDACPPSQLQLRAHATTSVKIKPKYDHAYMHDL